jgi:chromosome partitioning protein
MAKIIALFNQAGGVGKTTMCQNIGYQLASNHSKRVLLVDIDPQADLTLFMGLKLERDADTVYQALMSEEQKTIPVYSDIHNMSLSPATIDLAEAEQLLIMAHQRELRLQQSLAPIIQDFDYILIDCPPGLGLLTINGLVAANYVLVPIQTQYKGLMGTDALLRTVSMVQKRLNPNLKFGGFCPTMYSAGNTLDQRILASIDDNLSQIGKILPAIPRATAIAEASEAEVPFGKSNKKQQPILDIFNEIVKELEALT